MHLILSVQSNNDFGVSEEAAIRAVMNEVSWPVTYILQIGGLTNIPQGITYSIIMHHIGYIYIIVICGPKRLFQPANKNNLFLTDLNLWITIIIELHVTCNILYGYTYIAIHIITLSTYFLAAF